MVTPRRSNRPAALGEIHDRRHQRDRHADELTGMGELNGEPLVVVSFHGEHVANYMSVATF
jgi:hypothetical protein